MISKAMQGYIEEIHSLTHLEGMCADIQSRG